MNATDSTKDVDREVLPLRSAALEGADVPSRVLLTPWGGVESTNGSFVVDEESARLAVAAFEEHGTDLPIDYEHQTLGGSFAAPNGQAPAAGWIKRIIAEPGVGLLAEIEWTEPARRQLAERQYRYLSPVALVRRADRKLIAIHSAALTNKPAIVGMQPIVNSTPPIPTPEDDGALGDLRAHLHLPEDADAETLLVAARRRIDELVQAQATLHAQRRLEEAARAGKLCPAQHAWAEALLLRDEALFDEWLRTAPVLVAPGRTASPHRADAVSRRHALTARAQAEFRANPLLAQLTSEEAYVAASLRIGNGE